MHKLVVAGWNKGLLEVSLAPTVLLFINARRFQAYVLIQGYSFLRLSPPCWTLTGLNDRNGVNVRLRQLNLASVLTPQSSPIFSTG
jgi:hypothetical protein